MNFYTNVTRHKGNILVRGIRDGKPYKFSAKYKPYLFIPSNKPLHLLTTFVFVAD
jgi:hypothetical protein